MKWRFITASTGKGGQRFLLWYQDGAISGRLDKTLDVWVLTDGRQINRYAPEYYKHLTVPSPMSISTLKQKERPNHVA